MQERVDIASLELHDNRWPLPADVLAGVEAYQKAMREVVQEVRVVEAQHRPSHRGQVAELLADWRSDFANDVFGPLPRGHVSDQQESDSPDHSNVGSDFLAAHLHRQNHQAEGDNEETRKAAKWGDSGAFGAAKGAESQEARSRQTKKAWCSQAFS